MTDPTNDPQTTPPGLKPASENPWYVLATIYGEDSDPECHKKNRRIWNGWACGHMSDEENATFAKQHKLYESELAPWTEAEQADVEQVFSFGRGKGMTRPDPRDSVDFSYTHFAGKLNMAGFAFSGDARFHSAMFSRNADFLAATFSGNASFASATFSGEALFAATTFGGDTRFALAKFEKDTQFNLAVFNDDAGFSSVMFGGAANFSSVTFNGTAEFKSVKFRGNANFPFALFNGGARFDVATFECAHFFNSTFRQAAHFQSAHFLNKANFFECHFSCPSSFVAASFPNSLPIFSRTILHQNTPFTARDEFWPTDEAPSEHGRESLARIRHAVAGQGLPDDTHYFFRWEMRFAGRIGSVWRRVPYRLFEVLSNFGDSIARPALGLAGLWAVFGLLYLIGFEWAARDCGPDASTFWTSLAQGFGLSFANIFAFFGFHGRFASGAFQDPCAWLIAASGFQTVFGFILLFFLGLALRNRFRLR